MQKKPTWLLCVLAIFFIYLLQDILNGISRGMSYSLSYISLYIAVFAGLTIVGYFVQIVLQKGKDIESALLLTFGAIWFGSYFLNEYISYLSLPIPFHLEYFALVLFAVLLVRYLFHRGDEGLYFLSFFLFQIMILALYNSTALFYIIVLFLIIGIYLAGFLPLFIGRSNCKNIALSLSLISIVYILVILYFSVQTMRFFTLG